MVFGGAGSVGWRPLLASELYDKAGITAVWERQPASSVRALGCGVHCDDRVLAGAAATVCGSTCEDCCLRWGDRCQVKG